MRSGWRGIKAPCVVNLWYRAVTPTRFRDGTRRGKMTGKGERPAACVEFRVRLLELGLALHLFRISVDAVEAHVAA